MKNGENSLKKVDYKVKSNQKCKSCGETLKQNAVNKGFNICYVCHKVKNGKEYKTKYLVENGHIVRPLIIVSQIKWSDIQKQNQRRNNFN